VGLLCHCFQDPSDPPIAAEETQAELEGIFSGRMGQLVHETFHDKRIGGVLHGAPGTGRDWKIGKDLFNVKVRDLVGCVTLDMGVGIVNDSQKAVHVNPVFDSCRIHELKDGGTGDLMGPCDQAVFAVEAGFNPLARCSPEGIVFDVLFRDQTTFTGFPTALEAATASVTKSGRALLPSPHPSRVV